MVEGGEEDVGAFTDDDTATVADDDVRTVAEDEDSTRIAELEGAAMLDELFSSLREFEELEAIHEELIKFSDSALNILSEFSSAQATKSSEQIGKILYKFITTPIKEYMDELV